ncbi:unnamed protein product [Effrenium voratum]|uniref:Uncharacterized protein n=1 Tax=Effrenium voratum TaxID=2562239 RepID=A0AA36JJ03_9DINO|nr:unnamed protein product [Effrenium voratum]
MACPINLANCKFHSASLIYPMAAANAALAFAFAFLAPGVFAVPTAQLGSSAPCAPGKACEVDGFVGTEVIFEDDLVRVWNFTLPPGGMTSLHSHDLDYHFVALNPAQLAVYDAKGEWLFEFRAEGTMGFRVAGDFLEPTAGHMPKVPRIHAAVNIGPDEYHEILVEQKCRHCVQANWRQQEKRLADGSSSQRQGYGYGYARALAMSLLPLALLLRLASGTEWRHAWRVEGTLVATCPWILRDLAPQVMNVHPSKKMTYRNSRTAAGGNIGLPLEMGWEASRLFADEANIDYLQYSSGKFCNNPGKVPFLLEGLFEPDECISRCTRAHNCAFATLYPANGWCQLASKCLAEGSAGDTSAVTFAKVPDDRSSFENFGQRM